MSVIFAIDQELPYMFNKWQLQYKNYTYFLVRFYKEHIMSIKN